MEKTHDFRQSVGMLFSHEKRRRVLTENRTHDSADVKGACATNHCATEAPSVTLLNPGVTMLNNIVNNCETIDAAQYCCNLFL